MGYRMVTVKLVTPIRLERNISKTTWARDFKFGMQLYMRNAERTFPESGRGLGHVTHNFWHTIEHIFETTSARDFKFGKRLWLIIIAFLTVGFCILWSSVRQYGRLSQRQPGFLFSISYSTTVANRAWSSFVPFRIRRRFTSGFLRTRYFSYLCN